MTTAAMGSAARISVHRKQAAAVVECGYHG